MEQPIDMLACGMDNQNDASGKTYTTDWSVCLAYLHIEAEPLLLVIGQK